MSFVIFEVDAAVEEVDGVGVGGDGDGVAAGFGGVDASGAGAEVEGVLLDFVIFEVDDGHRAGFAVAD